MAVEMPKEHGKRWRGDKGIRFAVRFNYPNCLGGGESVVSYTTPYMSGYSHQVLK